MKWLLVPLLVLAAPAAAEWGPHWQSRQFTIARHSEQMVPGSYVLLVGDSILEAYHPATLCGRPVLNAGLGGAGVLDVLHWVPWPSLSPAVAFVMIGMNDAWPTTQDRYREYLAGIVMRLNGHPVRLLHVPLAEPWGIGATVNPAYASYWWNPEVDRLGAVWGLQVLPWPTPSETVDGIHPTAATYARLTALLDTACPP